MSFVKNREEKDAFELGFTNRLAADETISGATVVVEWAALFQWFDVTADCLQGSPTVTPDGKTVQFVLKAAPTEEDQLAGRYRIVITATTSKSRLLVANPELEITR